MSPRDAILPWPRRACRGVVLLAGAWITVLLVRLGLSLFSYARIDRHLPRGADRPPQPAFARHIAAAVRRSARLVPGASCLTQAVAGRTLLAIAGHRSDIRIGVARGDDGTFRAHAWLVADGRFLLGGGARSADDFAALTSL